jgi:hypothetical protein
VQGGNDTGGALYVLDVVSGHARQLLDNFHGLRFNSPNDVVVSREGLVYFTDPSCGLQQHFRSDAQLGEYVWRFDPRSGAAAVAADGFLQVRPLPFWRCKAPSLQHTAVIYQNRLLRSAWQCRHTLSCVPCVKSTAQQQCSCEDIATRTCTFS